MKEMTHVFKDYTNEPDKNKYRLYIKLLSSMLVYSETVVWHHGGAKPWHFHVIMADCSSKFSKNAMLGQHSRIVAKFIYGWLISQVNIDCDCQPSLLLTSISYTVTDIRARISYVILIKDCDV